MRRTSGPRKRGRLPILAAAVLPLALATSVQAEDPQGWVGQTRLTGDWGGARTRLEQSGVTIAFQYYTNLAGNPVGGRAQRLHVHGQPESQARLRHGPAGFVEGRPVPRHVHQPRRIEPHGELHRQSLHGPADLRPNRDVPPDRDDGRAVVRRRGLGRARGALPGRRVRDVLALLRLHEQRFLRLSGRRRAEPQHAVLPGPVVGGPRAMEAPAGAARAGRRLRGEPDARRHARLRLVHERFDRHGGRRGTLVRARRRGARIARTLQARRLVPEHRRRGGRPERSRPRHRGARGLHASHPCVGFREGRRVRARRPEPRGGGGRDGNRRRAFRFERARWRELGAGSDHDERRRGLRAASSPTG